MTFSSLKKETLEARVYNELRTAIVKRHLAHGERLIQDVLAMQFGTSRIPVRDALKRLETEGLVTLDERGSYVVHAFGNADIEEVYGLRMVLEPYAASKAMARMGESDIKELAAIEQELRKIADQQDIERYVELNQLFHMTFYEFSQQHRLTAMIRSLWSGLAPLTPIAVAGQLERSMIEHRSLLQALQTRQQPLVEELTRRHIQHAKLALQAHLETLEE